MATTEDRCSLEGLDAWRLDDATPSASSSSSRRSPASTTSRSTRLSVEIEPERDLGYPGVYPSTRGVYPSMYRGKLWTMRQFAGFGTAAETNARFRYLLDHGQTGLSTAFDMPTLMGYDSDHARSLGEVGREGVAIDSLEDMETLFAGTHLTGRLPARREFPIFKLRQGFGDERLLDLARQLHFGFEARARPSLFAGGRFEWQARPAAQCR